MSVTEAVLRALVLATPLHRILNSRLREAVIDPSRRQKLNNRYLRFGTLERAFFHLLFNRAFRGVPNSLTDCEWTVSFLGRTLRMPLRHDSLWLDWNNASAITGHDIEVIAAYESLLTQKRPKVFFDVGTNYGTHSLLMLSQGVKVISFEPNPECHEIFRHNCELNDLRPTLEPVAVGETEGTVELCFPSGETWLGSVVGSTKDQLKKDYDLESISVAMTTIDTYVERTTIEPDVIKIDTEGNEVSVIKGASKTLSRKKPFILFEANVLTDRRNLWEELQKSAYEIAELTLDGRSLDNPPITFDDFVSSRSGNFLARPRGEAVHQQN